MSPEAPFRFMQGNEAVAEGAIEAGISFYGGYPITPSSEIMEIMSQRLPRMGKIFIQMEDELGSIASVIGASVGGAKAATATSGPGFSLMQENLGFAALTEVPCVIINVQRSGPSTGLPTGPSQGDVMQARWGTHGDHPIIALSPSSVKECYEVAIRAFNLAEKYRTPVIILMDEMVGHIREKVQLPPHGSIPIIDRERPKVSQEEYLPYEYSPGMNGDVNPMAIFGDGYRYLITGLFHDKHGLPTENPEIIKGTMDRLFRKIENNLDDIIQFQEEALEDAEVAIISYGGSARSSREAMKMAGEAGIKVGMLRLITLWPFPEARVAQLAGQVKRIVVPEMNRGQMILEINRVVQGKADVIGVNRVDGQPIDPKDVLAAIKG